MANSAAQFVWDDSCYAIKTVEPVRAIVAYVRLYNLDFQSACGKAFPELDVLASRLGVAGNIDRSTDLLGYPMDPNDPDPVFIEPGFLLGDDTDLVKLQALLEDTDINPLADPDNASHGRKFRLFESGGECAVYRVRGAFSNIMPAYMDLFKKLDADGYEAAHDRAKCFDLYINIASNPKEEDQVTEIYIPVRRKPTKASD